MAGMVNEALENGGEGISIDVINLNYSVIVDDKVHLSQRPIPG
jgi:hypothetical protein